MCTRPSDRPETPPPTADPFGRYDKRAPTVDSGLLFGRVPWAIEHHGDVYIMRMHNLIVGVGRRPETALTDCYEKLSDAAAEVLLIATRRARKEAYDALDRSAS